MHYAGYPCQMDALLDICERHDLFLIEDAAHAPGASWNGRALGTIGDVGCFSFFGNKNMTTGEGGMVLARDPEVLAQVRLLRSHGMTTMSWDRYRGHASAYDVVRLGLQLPAVGVDGAHSAARSWRSCPPTTSAATPSSRATERASTATTSR